jgi:hypothetical protein
VVVAFTPLTVIV